MKSSSNPSPRQVFILTLFPEAMTPYLASSLLGKAQAKGLISVECIQIRDFAQDKHRSVDDMPYGGGEGMLLRVDVLHRAWSAAKAKAQGPVKTLLLSPQGPLLTSAKARALAESPEALILVCGHYEGVDERFIELCVDEEISIGNYVLSGGELPALVVLEAFSRFIPGVIGQMANVEQDSFEQGVLKYPQYTRPPEFEGQKVPEILTSGDHGKIAKWRTKEALARTKRKRPDLG